MNSAGAVAWQDKMVQTTCVVLLHRSKDCFIKHCIKFTFKGRQLKNTLYQKQAANALWRKQGIREIKVCKKCPKVNPYCDAICDPILIKPFLDGAK